jgi:hypothetical protein
MEIRRRGLIGWALLTLIAVNYFIPVGRVSFDSRAAESLFYGMLVFSPVFCAGLLFSSSFKESSSTASDFGANLLGAIVGGVGEYLSLLAGYRFLLVLVAGCYVLAMASRRISDRGLRNADSGVRSADSGLRTADSGVRTADSGVRNAEPGSRTANGEMRIADTHRLR